MWTEYCRAVQTALEATQTSSVCALARSVSVAWTNDRTIYTCGNGGSASTASHLAQDLSKGTLTPGQLRIRTFCLCDSIPSLTAWANDDCYDYVFAQQLRGLGRPGDLLIAISGSGNSPNILEAVRAAHKLDMRTWGVTGFDGGQLLSLAHRCVHVPCQDMGQVEAAHGILFHWLIGAVRDGLLDPTTASSEA